MTTRPALPALWPGAIATIEEDRPVTAQLGDDVGPSCARQTIVQDVAEKRLALDRLVLDIPLWRGVPGDEMDVATRVPVDRHRVHHEGVTHQPPPVEEALDHSLKSIRRDEPSSERSCTGVLRGGPLWAAVDDVIDVDGALLIEEGVEPLSDTFSTLVRPACGAVVAEPSRHGCEILESSSPEGVERRARPPRVHARPIQQEPSRDIVQKPVVAKRALEPTQRTLRHRQQLLDEIASLGPPPEVPERPHPMQRPIGNHGSIIRFEVRCRCHGQHSIRSG